MTAQKHTTRPLGTTTHGIHPQASLHTSHSLIGSRCHLAITALQQAMPRKQWRWEHTCGRAKCLRKTRWLRGRTRQLHSRHGWCSRPTSPNNDWNANNTPEWRQNNRVLKRQRFLHRRQLQPKKKANCRQCCLQCCRNNRTNKLQQRQQQTRPTWTQWWRGWMHLWQAEEGDNWPTRTRRLPPL